MKIELNKQDIIQQIKDNYNDDVDFLVDIVYDTTNSWDSLRNVIKKICDKLNNVKEMDYLIEVLNDEYNRNNRI